MFNFPKVIEVTEEKYEYALSVLPPFYGSIMNAPEGLGACEQMIQISEACDIVSGKMTYSTYSHHKDESGKDRYYYLGDNHKLSPPIADIAEKIAIMS